MEDLVDEETGEVVSMERYEIIVDRDEQLTEEKAQSIIDSGTKNILLKKEAEDGLDYSVITNTLLKDPSNSQSEAAYHIYKQLRGQDPVDETSAMEVINNLFFSDKRYDLGDVGRYRINKKLNLEIGEDVKVLTNEDIAAIIQYLVSLKNGKASLDDIDHLSNRRVRTVGEQLSQQFSIGLARMARTVRERMNVRDNEVFTPLILSTRKRSLV